MYNHMKKFLIVLALLLLLSLTACERQESPSYYTPGRKEVFSAQDVSLTMIFVPGKNFFSGTDDKTDSSTGSFWISETEVTYELWQKVCAWAVKKGYEFANPGIMGSMGKGSNQQPVTTLNWRDTIVWSNALTEWYNAQNGMRYSCVYEAGMSPIRDARGNNAVYTDTVVPDSGAMGFRIPTTDEWELAARFREDTNADGDIEDPDEYYPGNFASGAERAFTDMDATKKVAVFFNDGTEPVKSKAPNALGIYDMCGNVDEWCFGWFPGFKGSARLSRGGNWLSSADLVQIGLVNRQDPYTENFFIGFRVARNR
jgi:sulfatase modifying factor 1